jgi:hypothetical protein
VLDGALAAGAAEDADLVPLGGEALDHVAADEAGSSGDRDAHLPSGGRKGIVLPFNAMGPLPPVCSARPVVFTIYLRGRREID